MSFLKINNIAKKDPKLEIISKLNVLNISVLNKFLNKYICPLLDTGNGSVIP